MVCCACPLIRCQLTSIRPILPLGNYIQRTVYLCAESFVFLSPSADHKHLTTFVLDRKDAMITVDDGIRKLKLLDAKGKVWTQDMILQVDDRAVSLIDLESKASVRSLCCSVPREWESGQIHG